MAVFSIAPTIDVTKINNKKNTVVIPNDADPSSFDILIKNKLYLEDLYKYLHIYNAASVESYDDYVEVVLEIASVIDDDFISHMSNRMSSVPIMYPDSTKPTEDGNAILIPGYEVAYTFEFSYDSSLAMIYKNTDNLNTIKIKAKHNIRVLLSRVISKLSGDTPLPSSLSKYADENNLIDMTLPEFVELYTTVFSNEVSYDTEGNPYIMSIMTMHAFLDALLNFKELNTFDMTVPSDRSQYNKRVSKSRVWELPDSSFDTIYIANKHTTSSTVGVSDIIENIKYKNNFILEKSEDGMMWYPILGVPYTSEKSVNVEALNISLSDMKSLPTDTVINKVTARYITIDTPTDYMTPTNSNKYMYISSVLVYDESGTHIPFTISNKHFTNAKKNDVVLSDVELATILASDDINSCVKLETTDVISLNLDLGSDKSISRILIKVGDTSGADTTKYKYNVNYGLSLDNMNIAYTYENITEPPGQIVIDTPAIPVIIRDPWVLYTSAGDSGSYGSGS